MDEKLAMQTRDLKEDNVEAIARLFPSCVTEAVSEDGSINRLIDFEALKRQLSGNIIPDGKERYVFTWPGKSEYQRFANNSTTKTLRPSYDKSIKFDSTHNLYIEGDNLDALKILRETYLGKIKVIYIDPPYNTNRDYIYNDKYSLSLKEYSKISGDLDNDNNLMFVNQTSNGRFHTNWLNMIYSRLLLSKDLLSDSGVIFISIDEREEANLKKILDEIYGESNFIGCLVWEATTQPTNAGSAKFGLQKKTESILMYSKNKQSLEPFLLDESCKDKQYPHVGKHGKCRFEIIEKSDAGDYSRASMKFPILGQYPRPGKRWQIGEDTAKELLERDRLEIVDGIVKKAIYPEDENDKKSYKPFWSLLLSQDYGTAQDGKNQLNSIFGSPVGFDTVKPTSLIKKLISFIPGDFTVLDFFSGSATTGHAVFELNKENNRRCNFILVQYPVPFDKNDEAYNLGLNTIADLGKERLKIIGNREFMQSDSIDTGFRYFIVDSSNMNDVYYDPQSLKKNLLDYSTDNIKSDRSRDDLLFQVMLELGIELSVSIVKESICGKEVFLVDDCYLIACFDLDIDEDVVASIANRKPYYAVFRDSSMFSDAVAINFNEIFKTYSPDTKTKVL